MITVEKAKEIHKAKELTGYSREELIAADNWMRTKALEAFAIKVRDFPKPYAEYMKLMVRCYYGSVETDQLLIELDCYPSLD